VTPSQRVRIFSALYAHGDTHEDLDLLGIASRKYFGWREAT
jgi:hypothetical protein